MKDFTLYPEALELKQLGFDEPCFAFYDESLYFPNNENQYGTFCNQKLDASSCSAPLKQQAFRWFREKHNLIAYPVWRIDNTWDMNIQKLDSYGLLSGQSALAIIKKPTYEEAEQACLDKLIEICKNK